MKQLENTAYKYEIIRTKVRDLGEKMDSPETAYKHVKDIYEMDKIDHELFVSVMLNSKAKMIGTYIISRGLLDRANSHAREVFRMAISCACAKIIIMHNHPSGDSTPSTGDILTTKSLAEAGKVVGIEIVDHIIIGENDYLSFREAGLME